MLIKLLELLEAVGAVAHELVSLRHIAQLPGQLQQPHLRVNDLLLSRYTPLLGMATV
jgi:hypothetical protein